MVEQISFPKMKKFYVSNVYEDMVKGSKFATDSNIDHVIISIAENCKFMADVSLKLLCLCHQVILAKKRVSLVFEGGEKCNCYSYFERCGFLCALPAEATISPSRPAIGADKSFIYRGNSSTLLEIREISPTDEDKNRPIPGELTDTLGRLIGIESENFLTEIQTVVSEFCGNVPEHSQTNQYGYVYMQYYKATDKIVLSISDLGKGLLHTLREGLQGQKHRLAKAEDLTLIKEMLTNGLSRKGEHRGSGLSRAAKIVAKYKGTLHIRLDQYIIDVAFHNDDRKGKIIDPTISQDCLISIGTHITFSFKRPDCKKC